ncbi:membrane-bound alkaline phosphatase-like [Rhopalosiphum maidis]|uniref:membrane-bound alkaline phosphatase-like n=1 Tax=Rhopalosiphum maidis TaxID=43146 RepID=UPI000EFE74D0|nr:membrane-bound alkaline phosphatase-like [Rhopalosiphum maidis]XP_026808454.1 membrane-bound alkaline phosphatase-like [Rhopalosiphum maidis]
MWTFVVCVLACALQVSAATSVQESDSKYWIENGKRMLEEKSKLQLRTNKAKNVIMFLGDGMSLTTLTAARIYKGQLQNISGESEHLSFEQFPFTGISKTYCVDSQVADSACTATAYLCGVKTNKATIGVTSKVLLGDCPASVPEEHRVTSIMQWAQWAGKATGIVTTTRVTHASPAGGYAQTAHRDWESDEDMIKESSGKTNLTQCEDIALQLITKEPGRNFKVIMGGGRDNFMKKEVNSTGKRNDEDLVLNWKNDKKTRFADKVAKYITNREELMKTDMSKTDFVLGLFHRSHMDYRLKSNFVTQPTLQEMTRNAIQLLQKEPNGYVLFVEGGLIDKAHHETWARVALDETLEFSKAVADAVALTSEDDTLIVVTSDHAHTMSMAGYPKRNANILGLTNELAMDNMTYTTLSYANGPKKSFTNDSTCHRVNVTSEDIKKLDYTYPSLVDLSSETHGGDDVMVFARGPMSHLFTGNYEQNQIALGMAMAAGISTNPPTSSSSSSVNTPFFFAGHTVLAVLLLGLIGISQSSL